MSERIFLSLADTGETEEAAIVAAFRSGWVAPAGPALSTFEGELAAVAGRKFAVALSSGTAALHLGLLNLGVGAGDVVVTASMTFAATANAVHYCGAQPVFVDSDETGNVNPELLAQAIDDQRAQGKHVAAVLPVDLLGKVVDHRRIDAIAAEREIPLLSDAAESLGAVQDGRSSCAFGEAAALSFNGNKIITTSGGGALLTDDEELATRTRYLATQARQPVIWYEHTDIGYNYRLSNLLAALGSAQLGRLDEMLERRRWIRLAYREFFEPVPGVTVFGGEDGSAGGVDHDNFWLTSILVDPERAGFTSTALRLFLDEHAIESRPLWKPMHLQPVYADAPAYVDGTSQRLFETGLSLPSGSSLSDEQFDRVLGTIQDFLTSRR